MTQEHPITPPPELIERIIDESDTCIEMIQRAYAAGADQELEACCDHLRDYQWGFVDRPDGTKMHRAVDLELARRPKPRGLKEQALEALEALPTPAGQVTADRLDTIRRALEALDD